MAPPLSDEREVSVSDITRCREGRSEGHRSNHRYQAISSTKLRYLVPFPPLLIGQRRVFRAESSMWSRCCDVVDVGRRIGSDKGGYLHTTEYIVMYSVCTCGRGDSKRFDYIHSRYLMHGIRSTTLFTYSNRAKWLVL